MSTTLNTFLLIAVVIEAIAIFGYGNDVKNMFTIVNLINERIDNTWEKIHQVEQSIDITKARVGDVEGRVTYVEDELDREH